MPRHCRDCRAWNPSPDDPREGECAHLPPDDAGRMPLTGCFSWCNRPPRRARKREKASLLAFRRELRAKDLRLAKHGETGLYTLFWHPRCARNRIMSGPLAAIKQFSEGVSWARP